MTDRRTAILEAADNYRAACKAQSALVEAVRKQSPDTFDMLAWLDSYADNCREGRQALSLLAEVARRPDEAPARCDTVPVVLESPYRGASLEERLANAEYLRLCLRDSLLRGEAPFASHALYVGPLDEDEPAERALGIAAGWAWGLRAAKVVVYQDRGISPGMTLSIRRYLDAGQSIEYRNLPHE